MSASQTKRIAVSASWPEDRPPSYIVFVVEDDPFIRMAAVELVVDARCEVFEAANADEAIRIVDEHPEITVLFTDVDMPGTLDGLKLAAVAKARKPELSVIVASATVNRARTCRKARSSSRSRIRPPKSPRRS